MTDSDKSYLVYMAAQILEMRRLLKPTGGIYLHCDPTMSHYLKLVMDAIFGRAQFRAEIVWKRTTAHSDTKQGRREHGRIHDVLFFYSAGKKWTWNSFYTPYDATYIRDFYRHVEEGTGKRYQKGDLTAAKPGGDTEYEWRIKRTAAGSGKRTSRRNGGSRETVESIWAWGRIRGAIGRMNTRRCAPSRGRGIAYAQSGMPRYKRYLDEMPGVPPQDLWTDIPAALGKERTAGFPRLLPWGGSGLDLFDDRVGELAVVFAYVILAGSVGFGVGHVDVSRWKEGRSLPG